MWKSIIQISSFMLALSAPAKLFAIDEVKPLLTVNVPMTRYGISWQITQTRLLVKNIAYVKKLTLVYEQDGKEQRVAASYFGPADKGYEIWEAHSNIPAGSARYHVEYEVNGASFVDDNEGKSYPLIDGPFFYEEQNISQILTGKEFYDAFASFTAVVRSDLADEKTVTLHYSFDDFASAEQSVVMKFQIQYVYGYGIINSPSSNNTELFYSSMGDIPEDVHKIRYYFSFEGNGQTFYDNNYGRDYTMTRALSKSATNSSHRAGGIKN